VHPRNPLAHALSIKPTIDEDARIAYLRFLQGAPLPGREHG